MEGAGQKLLAGEETTFTCTARNASGLLAFREHTIDKKRYLKVQFWDLRSFFSFGPAAPWIKEAIGEVTGLHVPCGLPLATTYRS